MQIIFKNSVRRIDISLFDFIQTYCFHFCMNLMNLFFKTKPVSELLVRSMDHTGQLGTLDHIVPNIRLHLPRLPNQRMYEHLRASVFEIQKYVPTASAEEIYGSDFIKQQWAEGDSQYTWGISNQEFQPNLVEEIFGIAFKNDYLIGPDQRFLVSFGNNKCVVSASHHRYDGPQFAAITREVHYLLGSTESSKIRIEPFKRGHRLGPIEEKKWF